MKRVVNFSASAYLEYALVDSYKLLAVSMFDRSNQTVKSVAATLSGGGSLIVRDGGREKNYYAQGRGSAYVEPMRIGKERVTRGFVVSDEIGSNIVITTKEHEENDLFQIMMKKYKLPLMKEWTMPIVRSFFDEPSHLTIIKGDDALMTELTFPVHGKPVPLEDLRCYCFCSFSEEMFEKRVSDLLKEKVISISPNKQQTLSFDGMDDYFYKYGSGVMENLKRQLKPVSEHTDTMKYEALKEIRLYPQQISTVSGIIEYLRKKGKYAILNCGMGTGKTIMASSAVDGYFNASAMEREHKELKYILKHPELTKYRNIVMCPPHLVNKWVKEINSQIPHAKACAITDFSQLLELKERGRERIGKEWYVISKDFGKLSYMVKPAVSQLKYKEIKECRCSECNDIKPMSKGTDNTCRVNGCDGVYVPKESGMGLARGFVCPSCGEVLFTPARKDKSSDVMKYALSEYDFLNQNGTNSQCWFCGNSLWEPYVRNLGSEEKTPKWQRWTHYKNKAHKGKDTVWLFNKTEGKYFQSIGEEPLDCLGGEGGVRKFAPATYIKKQLKGFFDFCIFDEMHQYKAGTSAQGNAMHALIKASRFTLGLTGTIVGGYATHLFYLLFRLDPKRMIEKGFSAKSEMQFAEQYGTIERVYEAVESWRGNKMSKGRQIVSPKVKPGISPKVFTDFLMDRAVFLDLSDMSSFLPPLKEKVVLVDTEEDIRVAYNAVIDKLKEKGKESGGFGLMSTMLQFSLSYCDKPYGVGPIIHPKTGEEIIKSNDLSYLVHGGELLNKEKELVKLINSEISEGRNVVIFAEYTNSEDTCITKRLQDIIERNCGLYGEVQIIEASSPKAIDREQWLHEKAAQGIRVFITNPKILETGVDLCFTHNGVPYNYPTLIFYQLGYSLFTLWQASRRAYRLNQLKECRTYYMASKDSIQPAVIKLLALKQNATVPFRESFLRKVWRQWQRALIPVLPLQKHWQKGIQNRKTNFKICLMCLILNVQMLLITCL